MESAKYSLQDQLLLASSSSTLLDSSSYAAATTTGSAHICWTPNNLLNSGAFGSYANAGGALVNSRNPRPQNDFLVSSLDASMTQDLSFDWGDSTGRSTFTNNPSSHDLQFSQIKQELSDSYSKFSEMISSPSSTIVDLQNQSKTCYGKEHRDINDINVKLLLRTLSSGGQINSSTGLQSCPEDFYCSSATSPGPAPSQRGTFSQICPTINVSNFSQTSLANSSSTFDMNLQALDLLHSARFGGSLRQSLHDQLGLSRSGHSYGLDYMKQSIQRPMHSSNMTPFSSGVAEAKRSDVVLESKAPQAAAKRSRLESRASCPPFKVRKEKLGDRIAALQQLVAPFGKTDTASVLMEAIGYIKFLQNQVETLSVPYLKSSRNKTQRAVQGGPAENGSEERKRDLRSRGLCLVPLSCLSYMTDSGGAVWPPPNFGGGT